MSTIDEYRAALADACDSFDAVTGYEIAPEDPTFPAAAVGPISELEYNGRFDGIRRVVFVVTVSVNYATVGLVEAQRTLDRIIDPTGLPAAIHGHTTAVWSQAVPLNATNPRETILRDGENVRAALLQTDVIVRIHPPTPTP